MKTRDTKELLILLRNCLPVALEDIGGICGAITMLEHEDIITITEGCLMRRFITIHRPRKSQSMHPYWWKYGSLKPRVRFLNKLISEL